MGILLASPGNVRQSLTLGLCQVPEALVGTPGGGALCVHLALIHPTLYNDIGYNGRLGPSLAGGPPRKEQDLPPSCYLG